MRLDSALAHWRGSHPEAFIGAWALVKLGRRIAGLLSSPPAKGQHPADSRYTKEAALAMLNGRWPWVG